MTRTEFLLRETRKGTHTQARIAMPETWSAAEAPGGIAQRKAKAMAMIFDAMPVFIGEQELIVGSRTIYGHKNEENDRSDMNLWCMPHYLNDRDLEEFGGVNGEFFTQSHYTPDFGRILRLGIDGILETAAASAERQESPLKKGWLDSVILIYNAISRWIERHADAAEEMAGKAEGLRREELVKISQACRHVAHKPPRDFQEAVQLFWFSGLTTIVENFRFVNYGRVDQFLLPWYDTVSPEQAQQLVDCLMLKMYDGADVKAEYFGAQDGQLNITLGGVTPEGEDAVNPLTFAFLDAAGRIRLPEPEIALRIHSKNPPEFLRKCAELSVSGFNCMAYYNDDQFLRSMIAAGMPEKDARNYAFDLCQDINIPGRAALFLGYQVPMTEVLLDTMETFPDGGDFEDFMEAYKQRICLTVQKQSQEYSRKEIAVRDYVADPEAVRKQVKNGSTDPLYLRPLMSPLPITSALYDNCLESGTDLCWFGCALPDRGSWLSCPCIAVNGLAALRRRVFDEKRFTVSQVYDACRKDFEGQEKMRQLLWTAPKWANDDDYVDLPAREVLECGLREILKTRTPTGGRHLAGIHQPHPVLTGKRTPATPEGRHAGTPIPVTLSPENGTMRNGPTAALRSAAKIDPMLYQWNFCVMLQYFSSVFQANEGPDLFASLLRNYFAIGGSQHQPNVINVGELVDAQAHPEKYPDLIVRMWGVSAHFVCLPKEVQDEFIARFENI